EIGETKCVLAVLRLGQAAHPLHPFEIGAGGKAAPGPGQQHHTDRWVAVELVNELSEAPNRRLVERVVDFRPLQGAARHRSVAAVENGSLLGDAAHRHHIRKSPNAVFATGAFSAAERPSPSTRRLSAGSMMPSSHSLAVA